jgi:hypothetical protein
MKFIFLAGGFTGFLIAGVAGWLADRTPDEVLLHAMLGCVAGAVLFRWFWSIAIQGMRETVIARQRAAATPTETKKKS